MKEKIYKLVLILMVALSLGSGSLAQNEIRKMLEAFQKQVMRRSRKLMKKIKSPKK